MAEPWIRVHANLAGKPIVWRAVEALHVSQHEAMGLLVQFWGAVSQHATHGNVSDIADAQLEAWAGWTKKRGRFAAFVREKHVAPDGRLREWEEYAGALEDRREYDRERKRKERERKSRKRHGDNQPDSPPEVTGTSTPTIRDETVEPEPLQGSRVLLPPTALAPEGARAPADGTTLPWRNSGPAVEAETARLEAEYFRRLSERADGWIAENPDDAAELERTTRVDLGLHNAELTDFQRRAVRESMLVTIREARGWPSSEVWIANERLKLMGETVAA